MLKSRLAVVGLGFISVFAIGFFTQGQAVLGEQQAPASAQPAGVQVSLSGGHTTLSWDGRDPSAVEYHLPLLYLHRQRQATSEVERTLVIEIADLAAGSDVQLVALSEHVNVATGEKHQESTTIDTADRDCSIADPCAVEWTLDASTMLSDFYTLRLLDAAGQTLWENPHSGRPDFVALDTWDVSVGTDGTDGTPYSVRTYYGSLFPFALGGQDLNNRLAPGQVADFIERQFAPLIRETWHTQVHEWGFGTPLHPEWDDDRVVEIIVTDHSHALFGGMGTCSRPLNADGSPNPQRRVWWVSYMDNFQAYGSLEDAYKATFAHEFFHLMQWNVRLGTGRPQDHWLNLFIEAQAIVASTVQYPEIELVKRRVGGMQKDYARSAQRYLSERLNTSYAELEGDATHRYDVALYWRFLYEQYRGIGIFRAALEEMARQWDPDVVSSMDRAMDAAFARQPGPFPTYEASLNAFAQANYALRLENGRCAAQELHGCEGLYLDPGSIYVEPSLDKILDYSGSPTVYDGIIPSSYGMDFVDIRLDPTFQGQPLIVEIQSDGANARFSVQVWRLAPGATKHRAVTVGPDVISRTPDGSFLHTIPQVDTSTYDRLALIITRVDAQEESDPVGAYTIILGSGADG
jgi:hypothetical protein